MKPIEIGITGGIGSGKSVVSHILHTMQYPVYDTDSRAKRIMDKPEVRQQLVEAWGASIILDNNTIDRAQLAQIVFNSPAQLARLNQIVHPAVRDDYALWVDQQHAPIVFVESAILHQAQMDSRLHQVWIVEADNETRITRVMRRNNMTRSEVEARISSQQPPHIDDKSRIIVNDNREALLPQIIKLLNSVNRK